MVRLGRHLGIVADHDEGLVFLPFNTFKADDGGDSIRWIVARIARCAGMSIITMPAFRPPRFGLRFRVGRGKTDGSEAIV